MYGSLTSKLVCQALHSCKMLHTLLEAVAVWSVWRLFRPPNCLIFVLISAVWGLIIVCFIPGPRSSASSPETPDWPITDCFHESRILLCTKLWNSTGPESVYVCKYAKHMKNAQYVLIGKYMWFKKHAKLRNWNLVICSNLKYSNISRNMPAPNMQRNAELCIFNNMQDHMQYIFIAPSLPIRVDQAVLPMPLGQ